ncbi:MAG: Flp pilus assembly complex ATPase component TadA [Deltaproteobacteria bacterium]|nr:Flp pilus assembly complex ATPase component TadA [Deltaproteobacteria bacterium]
MQPAIAPAKAIQEAITKCFEDASLKLGRSVAESKKDLIIGETQLSQQGGDKVITVVNYLITHAVLERASDIHIEPQEKSLRVRYRIDGILHHKTDLPLALAANLVSRIKVLCGLDIAERRRHQDGRIEARVKDQDIDLRVSTYVSAYGESVVIRILHRQTKLVDVDSLGFSPVNRAQYMEILEYPSGIILVTGPTGSGKTTSLYASTSHLNRMDLKIITVEDPVEYTIQGVIQGKYDPKLGMSHSDFLKSMMRQDPDVIMVGEIRDPEAADAVIQAALTGHKVVSTFHTDDTAGAILRLMDMGIETFLISSTVVSVVSQRLVRVLCPDCREPKPPDPRLLDHFCILPTGLDRFTFYQPKGCPNCKGTGFKGRTGIHELLVVNDAIRDAILAHKTSSQIRRVAREKGNLISIHEDGFYKATLGITTLEEVLRVVFHHEGDEIVARSPDEVIALCEGRFEAAPQVSFPEVPPQTPLEERPMVTGEGLSSLLEGEIYRSRFDTHTIRSETERMAGVFAVYQDCKRKLGHDIEPDLMKDFVDFLIDTAERLKRTQGAEFVEFSLEVKDDDVVIRVESLPREELSVARSQETGLRQVNYLK